MFLHRGLWGAHEPESCRWTEGCLAEGLLGRGKHGDCVWPLKFLDLGQKGFLRGSEN